MIVAAAPGAERAGRLDEAVVTALHDAGLFRMLAPRAFGGGEIGPASFAAVIETVARGDASTAWCLCQMAVCGVSLAYLEPTVAAEMFADPRAAIAWGASGDARAVAVDGGYRVSGTWDFGSGCHHAAWLGGHCPVILADGASRLGHDGRPEERTLLFRRDAAIITEVWRVLGLRATGSDRYSVTDLFVSEARAITSLGRWPDDERKRLAAPYRFSSNGLYGPGFAALALGNARGLLDDFMALAKLKQARWRREPLAANETVQIASAETDARIASALAHLLGSLADAEDVALAEGEPSADLRLRVRAAATFSIRTATDVAGRLFELAGTTAIFDGDPIERRFRDAHTISQHHQARVSYLQAAGKHLLGVATDLSFA
jgi:alkylation response protein AidB-like acyl-CoA dehydrogenase